MAEIPIPLCLLFNLLRLRVIRPAVEREQRAGAARAWRHPWNRRHKKVTEIRPAAIVVSWVLKGQFSVLRAELCWERPEHLRVATEELLSH